MGHRQKQKFGDVVTELQSKQSDLQNKFESLGKFVLDADEGYKEDEKYFNNTAISLEKTIPQVNNHAEKLKEFEAFHKICIDNYSDLSERISAVEIGNFVIQEQFQDLQTNLERFTKIMCGILVVFLLICVGMRFF